MIDYNEEDHMIIVYNEAIGRFYMNECDKDLLGFDLYHKALITNEPVYIFSFMTKKMKCIPLCIVVLKSADAEKSKNTL